MAGSNENTISEASSRDQSQSKTVSVSSRYWATRSSAPAPGRWNSYQTDLPIEKPLHWRLRSSIPPGRVSSVADWLVCTPAIWNGDGIAVPAALNAAAPAHPSLLSPGVSTEILQLAMLPVSWARSSYAKSVQVPLAAVPLNASRRVPALACCHFAGTPAGR